MSIADKIMRAKTDYDDVYDAGKEKIISIHPEKTVSGCYISVDDVSELPHNVKCRVTGVDNPETVTVTSHGKNLCGGEAFVEKLINSGASTTVDYENRTVSLAANSNTSKCIVYSDFKPLTQYTVFVKCSNSIASYPYDTNLIIQYTDGTYVNLRNNNVGNGITAIVSTSNKSIASIKGSWQSGTVTFEYDYFGVFEGVLTVDEFEAYCGQTLTPSADGTVEGMTSISPQMNIFTDNADAMLDVVYRQSTGIKTQYDAFWDEYQQYGRKTNYRNAFANTAWNPRIFKPKYKIVLPADSHSAVGMFYWFGGTDAPILDYRTVKDMIDTSAILSAQEMFQSARIDYIDVDFSNCESIYNCFGGGWQHRKLTHVKLKVSEKCTSMDYAFGSCSDLTDLFFTDGSVIAANLSVSACPLTKESITSIINALSSSVTGKTVTFNKTAKEAAFTADEWSALIATKPNWTISLI